MKKRVLALMLVLGMTFSLAACGSSNDKKSDDTKTETADKDSKEKMTTVKWNYGSSGNVLVTIAEEEGYFTVEDVVEDISRKMIRRHPHVFGETVTASDGQPLKEWGQIKAWEKQQMTYQEDPRRKKRRKKLVRILDRLLSL